MVMEGRFKPLRPRACDACRKRKVSSYRAPNLGYVLNATLFVKIDSMRRFRNCWKELLSLCLNWMSVPPLTVQHPPRCLSTPRSQAYFLSPPWLIVFFNLPSPSRKTLHFELSIYSNLHLHQYVEEASPYQGIYGIA